MTADEWLAALNEYPQAMGLTATADIGNRDLQAACYGSEQLVVCVDARGHRPIVRAIPSSEVTRHSHGDSRGKIM